MMNKKINFLHPSIFLSFFSLFFSQTSEARSMSLEAPSKYERPAQTQIDPRFALFQKQQKLLCKRSNTCEKKEDEKLSFRLIYQNRYPKPSSYKGRP